MGPVFVLTPKILLASFKSTTKELSVFVTAIEFVSQLLKKLMILMIK